jgi:uncharacterized protein GlcG (DUF336 family)
MPRWNNRVRPGHAAVVFASILLVTACGGGSRPDEAGTATATSGDCRGSCQNTATRLESSHVEDVLAQAVAEALARNAAATIAVVDRVGNVLALFRMNGADEFVTITSRDGVDGGLEDIEFIPATLAAIAKAKTAAYLSSEGNAFTTRTASQIVQAHFNPGEFRTAGGPLFGVQFSQLPCSDLVTRFESGGAADAVGPRRSPLGLSADPGGVPLYRNGTVVGGIGVIADGIYGLAPKSLGGGDPANASITDEAIAVAGSFGFSAPLDRRGDRITVEGKTLRFTEIAPSGLASSPRNAAAFGAINGGVAGSLVDDGPNQVYYPAAAGALAGSAFSKPDSGVRASTNPAFAGQDAFVLVDNANNPRFPPRAGTDGASLPVTELSANEVETILSEALAVANRARAQIRRPLGSRARVTISVVDTRGEILGIVRGRDAPVFGIDVSLQKARTAAFFSGTDAASGLNGVPDAEYLNPTIDPGSGLPTVKRAEPIGQYVTAVRDFLGLPTALADGAFAFADRSGGNLSRPFYPDGIDGNPPGPFSKPGGHDAPTEWSPFSVGLQLDLAYNALIQHVAFAAGLIGADAPLNCTGVGGLNGGFALGSPIDTVRSGIQIFPGSVPIYRGRELVGGIGVSGDGIEQDDLISFLGLHNAGVALGTGIGNAPADMRADRIALPGFDQRLRYVQCPQKPFLDSDEQRACSGK